MTYAELVRFHGASNHWRLGEVSGATAQDTIGGANGVISGGVTLNGESGMSFDGTTGKIQTAANVSHAPNITLEAWVRCTLNDNFYHPIMSTRPTGVMFSIRTVNNLTCYIPAFTPTVVSGSVSLTPNVWYHVVMINDGTTTSFYVNGVFDVSRSQVGSVLPPAILAIGSEPAGGSWWAGSIDEVAIYPRALTQAEIKSHYDTGLTGVYTLTVQSLPIGPSVPVIAGQVYALPAVPVLMTSSAQVQTSLQMSGPYTNVPNGQVNGVYLKSASNTNVTLSKYVISQ